MLHVGEFLPRPSSRHSARPGLQFVPASDASLLVVVSDAISRTASARVIALFSALQAARAPFVVDLHPAYTSLLVEYDPAHADHARVQRLLERLLERVGPDATGHSENRSARTIEVPVRYGGADGPDLEGTAALAGMSPGEVIERHAAGRYLVAFLGFLPGFAYLLGLDEALAVPRLPTPRTCVPRGSVAIGGGQAAIYPCDSPGGWRLIGRTDAALAPGWAAPGDTVRFVPVSR